MGRPNKKSRRPQNNGDTVAVNSGSTSAIKSVNRLAYASLKSKNGLAISSIKSINGLVW